MISCQLALYPLATKDFESVITKSLQALMPLESEGLTIEVGSMSTVIKGNEKLVWKAIQTLYTYSTNEGQKIVLNASFSNECGCDV
ncbi:YkoF family thiamine/hydroxymethylpyrimidine-binding protein [Tepidibacillus marianensis]|uniref:YkoF family thiamine/hydroxymethylpyrimidine-binding protein n=1 Tax=Tepidibacillus marianensis TaxID=3131995 RepID=UPI0030D374A8